MPDTAARDAQRAFNTRINQLREENARQAAIKNVAEYQAAARAGLIQYADPLAVQDHQKINWLALALTVILALLPFYFGERVTTPGAPSPVIALTQKHETRNHYRNVVTRAALPVTASLYTA